MRESDASINVWKETTPSVFRVRVENVTPCSLPNYSTRISEDSDLRKRKMVEVACLYINCVTPAPSVVLLGLSNSLKFLPVSIGQYTVLKTNESFIVIVYIGPY
jgi:hypothetical protein